MPGMKLLLEASSASPPCLWPLPRSRGISSAKNSFLKLFFFFLVLEQLSSYYKPGIERSPEDTVTNRSD